MTKKQIQNRLEYLRGEIENERISYSEIAELQQLAEHIEPSDVQLLQWVDNTCPECNSPIDEYYRACSNIKCEYTQ